MLSTAHLDLPSEAACGDHREPWVRPEVTRIEAGSAENDAGLQSDNIVNFS